MRRKKVFFSRKKLEKKRDRKNTFTNVAASKINSVTIVLLAINT